ncbi:CopC domain containing protein [Candidatus Nanopelagicaceae bacterium]
MKRFAALIGVIVISVMATGPALANSLVATSPIAGSTLKVAPSAVTISVEITPMDMGNEITVTDPAGRRVDDGTLTVAGNDIIVGMKPITESGVYTVNYNIISEMDNPLVGSFKFNFSTTTMSTPQEVAPTTPTKVQGSDFGTNLFVIGLLVVSFIVLVALALYARKIFNER